MQWFERARFELHPENAPPYNVLLGNEVRAGARPAAPTPAPAPADPCADVPDPVSARIISPGKCLKPGDSMRMEVSGFQPTERIGFWLNAPDGSIVGVTEQIAIKHNGGFIFETPTIPSDLPPGVYSFVFQGIESHHQAVVYFKVLKP